MEVRITEMKPSDEITLRTQFSDYSFRVIDPVAGKGILCGGRLGVELNEAVFVEAIRPRKQPAVLSGQIEPGDRAVFIVGGHDIVRLTTSIITEIVLSERSETSTEDC